MARQLLLFTFLGQFYDDSWRWTPFLNSTGTLKLGALGTLKICLFQTYCLINVCINLFMRKTISISKKHEWVAWKKTQHKIVYADGKTVMPSLPKQGTHLSTLCDLVGNSSTCVYLYWKHENYPSRHNTICIYVPRFTGIFVQTLCFLCICIHVVYDSD